MYTSKYRAGLTTNNVYLPQLTTAATASSSNLTHRYCIKYEYITHLVTSHGDGLGGEGQVGRGVDYEVHVGGVDRIVRSNHHGRSAVEDLRVYDVQ